MEKEKTSYRYVLTMILLINGKRMVVSMNMYL